MILECRSCHHLTENTELIRRPSGVSECPSCGAVRFYIRPFLRRGPDGRIILLVDDPGRGGEPEARFSRPPGWRCHQNFPKTNTNPRPRSQR